MTIQLIRDGERAEIHGDDELIQTSTAYQAAFERKATEMIHAFYGCRKKGGDGE